MASIIAVVNLKGGTGKTTVAVNLACALAGKKASVVLIDADRQGSASLWFQQGKLPLRCDHALLEDGEDASRWLARVMGQQADYVVIDCPPSIGSVTASAVAICDLAIVPVTPSGVDLMATQSALDLIRQARASRNNAGPLCILAPSKVDRRTAAGREIEAALKTLAEPVGPSIGQRAAFVDAFTEGQWVGAFAPDSKAHAEVLSLARAVSRALARG